MILSKHFARRAINKHLQAGYREIELGPIGFEPEIDHERVDFHHAEFTAVNIADGEKVKGNLRYNRWLGVFRMAVEPANGRKPAPVLEAAPPPAAAAVAPRPLNRLYL